MGVSLSDGLRGWVEQDLAAYELALLLGVLPPGTSFATEAKHVFWSSNELGDAFEWQAVSARPGR
jgi:hypothetical protein